MSSSFVVKQDRAARNTAVFKTEQPNRSITSLEKSESLKKVKFRLYMIKRYRSNVLSIQGSLTHVSFYIYQYLTFFSMSLH